VAVFFLTDYNPFFAPRTHSTDRRVCAVKKIIYNICTYCLYTGTRRKNVCRANAENASTHILQSIIKDNIIITNNSNNISLSSIIITFDNTAKEFTSVILKCSIFNNNNNNNTIPTPKIKANSAITICRCAAQQSAAIVSRLCRWTSGINCRQAMYPHTHTHLAMGSAS